MNLADHARGSQLLEFGRLDEAETLARESIAADPSDSDAFVLLARALWERRLLPEALSAAEQARGLAPQELPALYVRAGVLFAMEDWQACVSQCDELLALVPEDPGALRLRGFAHMNTASDRARLDESARRNLDAATSRNRSLVLADLDFSRALALDPSDADNHAALAAFEIRNRWWATGLASAERALAIDPNHGKAHLFVGLAHEQLGDVRSASESYVRAGRADSSSSLPIEQLRRVGKPVIGGLSIAVYVILRVGVTAGRRMPDSNTIMMAIVILMVVAALAWFFVIKPRVAASRAEKLAPEARAVLEVDAQAASGRLGRFRR